MTTATFPHEEETLDGILSDCKELWTTLATKFRSSLRSLVASDAAPEASSYLAQNLRLLDTASRILKRIETSRIANYKLLHPTSPKSQAPSPKPSSAKPTPSPKSTAPDQSDPSNPTDPSSPPNSPISSHQSHASHNSHSSHSPASPPTLQDYTSLADSLFDLARQIPTLSSADASPSNRTLRNQQKRERKKRRR